MLNIDRLLLALAMSEGRTRDSASLTGEWVFDAVALLICRKSGFTHPSGEGPHLGRMQITLGLSESLPLLCGSVNRYLDENGAGLAMQSLSPPREVHESEATNSPDCPGRWFRHRL